LTSSEPVVYADSTFWFHYIKPITYVNSWLSTELKKF